MTLTPAPGEEEAAPRGLEAERAHPWPWVAGTPTPFTPRPKAEPEPHQSHGSWRGHAWCTRPRTTKGINVQQIFPWDRVGQAPRPSGDQPEVSGSFSICFRIGQPPHLPCRKEPEGVKKPTLATESGSTLALHAPRIWAPLRIPEDELRGALSQFSTGQGGCTNSAQRLSPVPEEVLCAHQEACRTHYGQDNMSFKTEGTP